MADCGLLNVWGRMDGLRNTLNFNLFKKIIQYHTATKSMVQLIKLRIKFRPAML